MILGYYSFLTRTCDMSHPAPPTLRIEYYDHKTSNPPRRKEILVSPHQGWVSPSYEEMITLWCNDTLLHHNPSMLLLKLLDLIHVRQITVIRHGPQGMAMLELTPEQSQWRSLVPADNTLIHYAHHHQCILMTDRVFEDPRGTFSSEITGQHRRRSRACIFPLKFVPLIDEMDAITVVINRSSHCHRDIVFRVNSVRHWILALLSPILQGSWSQHVIWSEEYMSMVAATIPLLQHMYQGIKLNPTQPSSQWRGSILNIAHHINNVMDCYQLDTGTLSVEKNRCRLDHIIRKAIRLSLEASQRDSGASPDSVHAIDFRKPSHCPTVLSDGQRWVQVLINLFRWIQPFSPSIHVRLSHTQPHGSAKENVPYYRVSLKLTYYRMTRDPHIFYDRFTQGLVHVLGGRIDHQSSPDSHRHQIIITMKLDTPWTVTTHPAVHAQWKDTTWFVVTPSLTWTKHMKQLLTPWGAHVVHVPQISMVESQEGWSTATGVIVDTFSYPRADQLALMALCHRQKKPQPKVIGIGPCDALVPYTHCISTFDHNAFLNLMTL